MDVYGELWDRSLAARKARPRWEASPVTAPRIAVVTSPILVVPLGCLTKK